jgi:hypothetical protein
MHPLLSPKQMINQFKKKVLLPIPKYKPSFLKMEALDNYLDVVSAWTGLEQIIPAIIKDFNLDTKSCLEFGVDYGYSTTKLSNYFDKVTGVDSFEGDEHAGLRNLFLETKNRLSVFPNITLEKGFYQDFIKGNDSMYDMIHVDIIHTYEHTYECGLWAAQHSKCTIFHDTESFLEVRKAVIDVAKATGKKAHNYTKYNGLGIIV